VGNKKYIQEHLVKFPKIVYLMELFIPIYGFGRNPNELQDVCFGTTDDYEYFLAEEDLFKAILEYLYKNGKN
tara:strand:+ start:1490 stop:1705 length:216 start_codon:yes stop_codon:yes gene_type:complete